MKAYIYQQTDWPNFRWDNDKIIHLLGSVRHLQGKLVGKMEGLGFDLKNEANLETLSLDVVTSSDIEGEKLNRNQVRSSVARHLGLEIAGLVHSDRNVDGVVEMMMDAIVHSDKDLTKERLLDWQSSLFPSGRSGLYKIITGNWRDDSTGPMQVVSGPLGREKIHYQAPPARIVDQEMSRLLDWFNGEHNLDPVLKASLTHLWFVTIHPFEDGNGRIARALTDMILTRADGIKQRFYSMSSQIRKERKEYYHILEKTQKGSLNVTEWIIWFLNCLYHAMLSADKVLVRVLHKQAFWNKHTGKTLNDRQIKMLNRILDGFEGKVTSSKWAKIMKCSSDTALRDIQDLVGKEMLKKEQAGGRSTSYVINIEV